jgi:hypothetical protein
MIPQLPRKVKGFFEIFKYKNGKNVTIRGQGASPSGGFAGKTTPGPP